VLGMICYFMAIALPPCHETRRMPRVLTSWYYHEVAPHVTLADKRFCGFSAVAPKPMQHRPQHGRRRVKWRIATLPPLPKAPTRGIRASITQETALASRASLGWAGDRPSGRSCSPTSAAMRGPASENTTRGWPGWLPISVTATACLRASAATAAGSSRRTHHSAPTNAPTIGIAFSASAGSKDAKFAPLPSAPAGEPFGKWPTWPASKTREAPRPR
jgi:hypothetical protein